MNDAADYFKKMFDKMSDSIQKTAESVQISSSNWNVNAGTEMYKDMVRMEGAEMPDKPTDDDIKCVYPSFVNGVQNGYIVEFKRLVTVGKISGVDAIVGPGMQVFVPTDEMKLAHRVADMCKKTNEEAMKLLIPFLGMFDGRELKINLSKLTPMEVVMLRKRLVDAGWSKEVPLIV